MKKIIILLIIFLSTRITYGQTVIDPNCFYNHAFFRNTAIFDTNLFSHSFIRGWNYGVPSLNLDEAMMMNYYLTKVIDVKNSIDSNRKQYLLDRISVGRGFPYQSHIPDLEVPLAFDDV